MKIPFINDALSSRITQRVRQFSPDVRVVFTSSSSLKQKLVRSSLRARVCPRDVQAARKRPGPGRPMMCRACDAGMKNGECLSKNVVYCVSCALCGELYVGETGRPVRKRIQEHFRDARARAVKTP